MMTMAPSLPEPPPREPEAKATPCALPRLLRPVCLAAALVAACVPATAQDDAEQASVLSALPPELRHLSFAWARAQGDLNGDGVPDVAVVLTGSKGDAPREERLVVLAGRPGGGYQLLSLSGDLCYPSKFYHLEIQKNAVALQAVEHADASSMSSYTLQFRYNAMLQDLELIGERSDEDGYNDGSSYRISINHLTHMAVVARKVGKRYKEAKARMATAPALRPLRGFDCRNPGLTDAPVSIDPAFKVQKSSP